MRTLIIFLAAATCTTAETPVLHSLTDLPYITAQRFFDYDKIFNLIPQFTTPPVSPTEIPIPEIPVSKDTDIISQYYIRDLLGQVTYGHVEPRQRHAAFQDASGNKIGGFSYIDNEGTLRQTNYIADEYGYRILPNFLPIPFGPTVEEPEPTAALISKDK